MFLVAKGSLEARLISQVRGWWLKHWPVHIKEIPLVSVKDEATVRKLGPEGMFLQKRRLCRQGGCSVIRNVTAVLSTQTGSHRLGTRRASSSRHQANHILLNNPHLYSVYVCLRKSVSGQNL